MDSSYNAGIGTVVRQYLHYVDILGYEPTHREFASFRTYESFALNASKERRARLAETFARGDRALEGKVLSRWGVRRDDGEASLSSSVIWLSELQPWKDAVSRGSEWVPEELLHPLRPYYAYVGPRCRYVRLANGGEQSIYSWLCDQEDDFFDGFETSRETARIFADVEAAGYWRNGDARRCFNLIGVRSR